jgi:hypothetical protein
LAHVSLASYEAKRLKIVGPEGAPASTRTGVHKREKKKEGGLSEDSLRAVEARARARDGSRSSWGWGLIIIIKRPARLVRRRAQLADHRCALKGIYLRAHAGLCAVGHPRCGQVDSTNHGVLPAAPPRWSADPVTQYIDW